MSPIYVSVAPVQFSTEVLIHTIILILYVQFTIFIYFPGKSTIRNNLVICCLHFATLQLIILIRVYKNKSVNQTRYIAETRLDMNILRIYRGAKTHIYSFIIWLKCNAKQIINKRYVSAMNTGGHHQTLSTHIPQPEMLISRGLSYSLIEK